MVIIPAIDLKDGQCVRLRQGLMDDTTVFSDNPVEMAAQWVNQGAKRLHLVDLKSFRIYQCKLVAVFVICKLQILILKRELAI